MKKGEWRNKGLSRCSRTIGTDPRGNQLKLISKYLRSPISLSVGMNSNPSLISGAHSRKTLGVLDTSKFEKHFTKRSVVSFDQFLRLF